MENCDVLIIGAGPGGLAAATAAKKYGLDKVIVIERDNIAGGILNQCIHDGFGLIRYGEELSGPEYADKAINEAVKAQVQILTEHQVTDISADKVVTVISKEGLKLFKAGSVVLATGCRERTRGMISIPGSRPAGIFTAGVVQNLVNQRNVMVGKRVVILGSGDIGLIMARRLTLEGAKVVAVIEIMGEPCGLSRNVSQCLYDYDIPIYVAHTISNIFGKKRLEGVEMSAVDKEGKIIFGSAKTIPCDTLVLSVGLIPENEVAQSAGVLIDEATNAVITDEFLQTNIDGIFSCGNSRAVMDLADYVSEQGELAGENAARYFKNEPLLTYQKSAVGNMIKGFPAKNSITCTVCPNGCCITVKEGVDGFEGNKCKRGEIFARQELKEPLRTLTTTVKVTGGEKPLVSVRSAEKINHNSLLKAIEQLNKTEVSAPVKCGSEICEIVCDNNKRVKIIATSSVLKT